MKIIDNLKLGTFVAVGSSLLLTSPALAANADNDDAQWLKPSSNWQLNYADDSCRMARTFGEGDDRVAFYIERYGPSERFMMLAAGQPVKGSRRREFAHVQFGENLPEQKRGLTVGDLGRFGPALIFRPMRFVDSEKNGKASRVPGQRTTRETEAGIEWIKIKPVGRDPVILKTGSLGKPMAAIRKCVGELMQQWGIDLEKHKDLRRTVRPITKPSGWITYEDYPKDALRKGERGMVQVRLSVDATGTPSACKVQQATRPRGFDDLVCKKLMQRARFEPAVTKDGEKIASYWRNSVTFDIGS